MEDPKEKAQEFFNYFFKWEEKKKMKLADNGLRIYEVRQTMNFKL